MDSQSDRKVPLYSDSELQIYLNWPVWKIAIGELHLHLFKNADLKLTANAYAPTSVLCCAVHIVPNVAGVLQSDAGTIFIYCSYGGCQCSLLPDVLIGSHVTAASRRSLYYRL